MSCLCFVYFVLFFSFYLPSAHFLVPCCVVSPIVIVILFNCYSVTCFLPSLDNNNLFLFVEGAVIELFETRWVGR
ncbi:hypothetical protein F5X97DRAFT_316895 [Nemania serpens]|nr:hypothetical protein F5X97DRAFT_316895 [Nemania serpens]